VNKKLAARLTLDLAFTVLLLCALMYRATAAYWCLPLIGVHLGLNWKTILSAFRKMAKINGENRTRKIILCIIAFATAAFDVWSSFDRIMFSKLFLGFSFDYWPNERPAILFFAVNLSLMGVYVFVTHYVLAVFERKKRGEGES
jgi:hypothetical protein